MEKKERKILFVRDEFSNSFVTFNNYRILLSVIFPPHRFVSFRLARFTITCTLGARAICT